MGSGNIIYHFPFGLEPEKSGSHVHIHGMLRGFQELGYTVELVTGVAGPRHRIAQRLQREARGGRRFDFAYAWSPTAPSLAARRNLIHPFADLAFFNWCKQQGVPLGVFYGDVHWRFAEIVHGSAAQRLWGRLLHRYDWELYRKYADHLFLPDLAMGGALFTPWPAEHVSALRPGCNVLDLPRTPRQVGEPLRVFYVGGVRPPVYNLKPMIDAVRGLERVELTICCRQAEWEKMLPFYGEADGERVRVVHALGEALRPYYAAADVFGYFHTRHPYYDITMPVKTFESLGFGLPMITSEPDSLCGRFVAGESIGWAVEDTAGFQDLLRFLQANPQAFEEKRRRAEALRAEHTWQVRASQVIDTMTSYQGSGNRKYRSASCPDPYPTAEG